MFGISKKPGFTLIEILVALAIIAIVATVIIPNLFPRVAAKQREEFFNELNNLMAFAYQNGIRENQIQKIVFDLKNRIVHVETATGKRNAKNELEFAPVTRAYRKTTLEIPEAFEIKNFIIEGFDEKARSATSQTEQVWFYSKPDGITQDVIINILDTADEREIGLVLNPFSAQFERYDEYQK